MASDRDEPSVSLGAYHFSLLLVVAVVVVVLSSICLTRLSGQLRSICNGVVAFS